MITFKVNVDLSCYIMYAFHVASALLRLLGVSLNGWFSVQNDMCLFRDEVASR